MIEFVCMECGDPLPEVDAKNVYYEQDGDTIYLRYELRCELCGKVHRCTEVFKWDGVASIEEAGA